MISKLPSIWKVCSKCVRSISIKVVPINEEDAESILIQYWNESMNPETLRTCISKETRRAILFSQPAGNVLNYLFQEMV